MTNVPRNIVFHTVSSSGDHDISDIKAWHKARGMRTVGYHYYIRRNGQLQKGREEDEIGAHCIHQGMNRKSIGICLEGHGDYKMWTQQQTLIFLRLVKDLFYRYPITVEHVLGHRETGSLKTCPGTLIDCEKVRNLLRLYMYLN